MLLKAEHTQFCTCNFGLHNSGIVHCLGIFIWAILLLQNIHVHSVMVRDLSVSFCMALDTD